MKILKLTALLVIFLSTNFVYTQEKIKKVKVYKTWVSLMNESKIIGVLYKLNDSSIFVTDIKTNVSKEIYIKDIQKIKIRRKNSIGRGALIGGATGLVAGGLLGLAEGDDSGGWFAMSAEEKAVGYGVFFSGVGAGVGVLAGTIKKKFNINGSIDNYNKDKEELKEYVVKKERDQISLNNN